MISWKKTPALFTSLLMLVGCASAFFLPFFLLTFCTKKKPFWILPLLMFAFVKLLYFPLPTNELGKGQFHIEEIKKHPGPVKTTWVYRGTFTYFQGENKTYRNVPIRIYLPLGKKRPPANTDYSLEGTLSQMSPATYLFKPAKNSAWIPVEKTTSLAEWRFEKKEKVKQWIFSRFKDKKVALLISALATGNLESRFLAYHFNVVGLQHLLAISGFHFALLSFFLAFILKRFLPERIMAALLILLLSAYFFYMGKAPSISRAYIGISLFLIALLCHFRPSALNALGVALLAALLFDPLVITQIGFQLSFGATLGILFFYRTFSKKLHILCPKRPYKQLKTMPLFSQGAYLLCAYLRSALALQGAVLIFTLPLLLFHFHSFPLASLYYNLFIPASFSLLLALFLLHLDFLAAPFASFLITLIENAPKKCLFSLTPIGALVLALSLALAWYLTKRKKKAPKMAPLKSD